MKNIGTETKTARDLLYCRWEYCKTYTTKWGGEADCKLQMQLIA